MDAARLVVVLGRKGRPFRASERRQLAALARIVDSRWTELVTRSGRLVHPSAISVGRRTVGRRPVSSQAAALRSARPTRSTASMTRMLATESAGGVSSGGPSRTAARKVSSW